jgi:ketosteroid isomerase-like protein
MALVWCLSHVTKAETEAITQTVLDYFEGWFDGDTARMERALHPDLAKRQAGEQLGTLTTPRMVELTAQGAGAEDRRDGRVDIAVHDVYKDAATVTVRSATYHEYLHLVRTSGGWRIANALWQLS